MLARFDEDASWSDAYASVRTIYCKGARVLGCVPLETVGREGHTFLHHIVANYGSLADYTCSQLIELRAVQDRRVRSVES